jgi:1,4-alpha-glucan branching enzyme
MDLKWFDDYLNGQSHDAFKHFGAHFKKNENGEDGIEFLLYAPLAQKINLTGDFNSWSVYGTEMEKIDDRGLFRYFVKGGQMYQSYKFHVLGCDGQWRDKADPFGFFAELRPSSASRTFDIEGMIFHDEEFMKQRDRMFDKPMSIYEMHLGSWLGMVDGRFLSYEEIAPKLIDYIHANGFTTVEIMPITQYPYDGSWGYQATGYFSVDSRYGNPKQLMSFVDRMHQAGIGVILDFVPVHFATDPFGLERFDGSCMYEYQGDSEWSQWGTKNFDLGKDPVRSFLISSMCYFLEYFHFDGLRLDAVSNLIYWAGNCNRGINQGGVDFAKRANWTVHTFYPGAMMIAEDSTAYGLVTKGFSNEGLGFDYKWDLGWMNDTLRYYKKDPIYKPYHQSLITFSMAYFYSENFVLPLSHDEVVHMKGTILNKMWGDYGTKFALARNLYAYQFAHPGKKLNFMGNELATFDEWNEKKSLAWELKKYPIHDAFSRMFRDLNLIYQSHPSMYTQEYNPLRFHWIMADNAAQSVFAFYREAKGETIVFIFNMTPNYYEDYRVGVPFEGSWREIFNSEREVYNGSGQYNGVAVRTESVAAHEQPFSIRFKLASYGALYFVHEGETPLAPDELPTKKEAAQANKEEGNKAPLSPKERKRAVAKALKESK